MQLRRALLIFALVLTAISLGAALSAPDDDEDATTETRPAPRPRTPPPVSISLRNPAPEPPPRRRVRTGAHVVLRVSARVPGNVEVTGLGLVEAVSPGTPAVFDLLASRPGSYEVVMTTLDNERLVLGTLVVAG